MPKSKSKRRRYQPPPKKNPKPSPRWFGWLVLGLMGLGVAVIVLNYMGLVPGGTRPAWLYSGLAAIALGFVAATRWR